MFKRFSLLAALAVAVMSLHIAPASAFDFDSFEVIAYDIVTDIPMIDSGATRAIDEAPDIGLYHSAYAYIKNTTHTGLILSQTKRHIAPGPVRKAVGISYAYFG